MLQKQLASKIDPLLHKTQYAFRKNRSTAHAIHIIRRLMDVGYRAGTQFTMVLLDWEKAFDKISHNGLRSALEAFGLDPMYLKLIDAIYANPQFSVAAGGQESTIHTAHTGIR